MAFRCLRWHISFFWLRASSRLAVITCTQNTEIRNLKEKNVINASAVMCFSKLNASKRAGGVLKRMVHCDGCAYCELWQFLKKNSYSQFSDCTLPPPFLSLSLESEKWHLGSGEISDGIPQHFYCSKVSRM